MATRQIIPGLLDEPDALIMVEDAAVLLSVTPRFLMSLIARGQIPAVRVGSKMLRLKVADVLLFIENNRTVKQQA